MRNNLILHKIKHTYGRLRYSGYEYRYATLPMYVCGVLDWLI